MNNKFVTPELEIISFNNDDIIMTSSFGDTTPGEGDIQPNVWNF